MINFILSLMLFSASPLYAEKFNISEYKGKVVYLDFWASWCEPCKESFPWLNKIAKENPDLVVIGINLDQEKSEAESFLKAHTPMFKIVFDPEGHLAEEYKVKGMPYSIIFSKAGEQKFSHIGFTADKTKEYLTEIKKLMGEK